MYAPVQSRIGKTLPAAAPAFAAVSVATGNIVVLCIMAAKPETVCCCIAKAGKHLIGLFCPGNFHHIILCRDDQVPASALSMIVAVRSAYPAGIAAADFPACSAICAISAGDDTASETDTIASPKMFDISSGRNDSSHSLLDITAFCMAVCIRADARMQYLNLHAIPLYGVGCGFFRREYRAGSGVAGTCVNRQNDDSNYSGEDT